MYSVSHTVIHYVISKWWCCFQSGLRVLCWNTNYSQHKNHCIVKVVVTRATRNVVQLIDQSANAISCPTFTWIAVAISIYNNNFENNSLNLLYAVSFSPFLVGSVKIFHYLPKNPKYYLVDNGSEQ